MNMVDIYDAQARLKNTVHHTALERSLTFSRMVGGDLYLKCENLQKTGSFKVRGAYNKIAKIADRGVKTVVASSAGNHAQGVAYAANEKGMRSIIVMPASTPIAKVSATENYGAQVVLHGDVYDDAYAHALELVKEHDALFIHPFDDEDVIAGQGTVALELTSDMPDLDAILVPAGGGGLLAGIAYAVKHINPKIKVIGVQAERADAIVQSFKTGKPVESDKIFTIADGIAVKKPGEKTLQLIQKYVDDMMTVSDDEIAATIIQLMERAKQIVEPAGATSLALALSGRLNLIDKKAACVLSGGNIDVGFIHKIIEKGLVSRGRQMKFSVVLADKPGSLEEFARIMGANGANIVSVQYDRMSAELQLNETILHVACEVSGFEHGRRVIGALEKTGYNITFNNDKYCAL
ncbi:MAG: threonine ammonia-lyase [Clostridia bacterium]|nr:threonine ammonia-lyase [Clostridia bacterium]